MSMIPRFETPYERGGIITPGLPILPHGTERYLIPGGGSRALAVFEGDAISLLDFDGLQPCEVMFFAKDGRSDMAMLGITNGISGRDGGGGGRDLKGIKTALARDASGARVLEALRDMDLDIGKADTALLFREGSKPGDMVHLQAQCAGFLVVCAPAPEADAHSQSAPTDIILYIKRAHPNEAKPEIKAPPPLAEPLQDFNIQPGHAQTYEVKAGEYIQVLDVKGRECSDFQAFSMRALDAGREREIDPTTTRSLTGSLYPRPGIFGKYWSVDQEALVEIVQDTCGRHDTFGLACTARYYDDLGYPGHINCSDNMNQQLDRFTIAPRKGWPAINFFFNTMLDDTNALGMDDPWSRPGDYVLLRALSDLVCVSTACPCDIDPANGWNPTDIQIRTYKATEDFQPSIGWRKSVEADVEDTKKTGFYDCFARHTRDFVEYSGYWLADAMTNHGAIAEYWACREKAVVMDLSPLRKYEITGPDAEALLQYCVPRDIKKLAIGQVVYTALCYEHGGMIDDGTIFRLGAMNFRWVGGNDQSGQWLKSQAQTLGMNAWVRPSTEHLSNIAIQGRLSREILEAIIWTPPKQARISELPWFRFTIGRIGDVQGIPVVVSRTGYTGELGYEIFCHPKHASEVFDAVDAVGAPLGMVPAGLAALDMLRIEAGLIFAGSEFDDTTDPMEAGIGFTVPLKSKSDDFIGRAALTERKAHPQRRLVGLELEGGIVPNPKDCLRIGKAQVGEITSAVKSPILGKVIALARVAMPHAEIGTAIEVGQLDGAQKRIKAKITPFPHFDPDKSRVKGDYS